MFTGLLTGLFNGSNNARCISLTNQKCITQPTFLNWHLNEYSHGFQIKQNI